MPLSSWLIIKKTLRKSKMFCSKVVMIDIFKDGVSISTLNIIICSVKIYLD